MGNKLYEENDKMAFEDSKTKKKNLAEIKNNQTKNVICYDFGSVESLFNAQKKLADSQEKYEKLLKKKK